MTAHSRESGNAVWVPAFAGTSGKNRKGPIHAHQMPARHAPDANGGRPVGWVERQRNPSSSKHWLRRDDGFHSFNAFLRLPQRSHLNAGRGRLGNIAVLSVQFVTVSTAPVFHARAARVERGERAVGMSDRCPAPQLGAEFRSAGALWIKNEAREKHCANER